MHREACNKRCFYCHSTPPSTACIGSWLTACPCPAALQINTAPFTDGWMMKIKLSNKGEASSLLDDAAYEKHCQH